MASKLEFSSKCPRCGSTGVDYGNVLIGVGKTRKLAVTLYVCGRCELVFYEKSKP